MNDQISAAFGKIDLEQAFDRVRSKFTIEYRDPMNAPYGDPDRNTRSQAIAWDVLNREGPSNVALVGAKGSGKTHLGGCFAASQSQKYPGSLGCVISNTYTQAKDNASPHLINACAKLNLPIEFFQSKKINGRPFASVFVIDLDGMGFEQGLCSYVLLRSFEAVHKLEGIELDWLWCEEGQDADKDAFATVYSRVRGKMADRSVYFAAMPRDEFHWMYSYLPQLGFIEEENYDGGLGILLEPSLMENIQNVGMDYLERLRATYDEEKARWYIEGRRSSLMTNKVFYSYGDYIHRKGRMSKVLCKYDPALPLVVSFDFNVAPMSASVYQVKRWSRAWDADNIQVSADGMIRVFDTAVDINDPSAEYVEFDDFESFAPPEYDVLAQIDEFEVWAGGTEGTCKAFYDKYGPKGLDHVTGGTVLGDATGNRQDTRSATTDWQIISRWFNKMPHFTIIKGLQQSYNYKTGNVSYSNPSRRDTMNVGNKILRDSTGKVSVCFLPTSELKSGGLARSVAMAKNKPDGNIDTAPDRQPGRDVARLHFMDTFRYVAWWFNGGEDGMSVGEFEEMTSNAAREASFSGGFGASPAFGF